MKVLSKVFILIVIALSSLSRLYACDDVMRCMICESLHDPQNYTEGSLKAMRVVAPGKQNWLYRSDVDFSSDFGIPADYVPEYRRLMSMLIRQKIQPVFILQPTRGMVARDFISADFDYGFDYQKSLQKYKAFARQLRSGGAKVPDLVPLIEAADPKYFFRRDHHWTPYGAKITAKQVAEDFENDTRMRSIKAIPFVTEESLLIWKMGSMNWSLNKLCDNHFGFQYVQGYNTYQSFGGDESPFGEEANPFGDPFAMEDDSPEIVLVGTSNSAVRDDEEKNYNFEGFLKEFLGKDILNYALAGGGQDGALLEYLLSEDYDVNSAPKYLFWELPVNYKLDNKLSYRQLIPAIGGGCEKSRVIASNLVEAEGPIEADTRYEMLISPLNSDYAWHPDNHFLEFTLSNKNLKQFYVITYFEDGSRDKVWFRRPAVVTGGKYYLELRDFEVDRQANVLSVFLQPSESYEEGSSIEVKLCVNH